jgi:nitrogen-specific signal transduction histidine kinase
MHFIFVLTLCLVLIFNVSVLFFAKKSRLTQGYILYSSAVFSYILLIYSFKFNITLLLVQATFSSAFATVLGTLCILKALTQKKWNIVDYVLSIALISMVLVAILTNAFVQNIVLVPQSSLQSMQDFVWNMSDLIQVEYGKGYLVILPMMGIVFIRSVYLSISAYIHSTYRFPIILSVGSILIGFVLTVTTNYLYPLLTGHSSLGFMPVFSLFFICCANFIAITKFQFLNMQFIITKSIAFIGVLSLVFLSFYILIMQVGIVLFERFGVIGFFMAIMSLIFLYPLVKEATKGMFASIFNRQIVSFRELYMGLSQSLLKASTIEDVLIIGAGFVNNIEGLAYAMQIQLAEGSEYHSGHLNLKNIEKESNKLSRVLNQAVYKEIVKESIYTKLSFADKSGKYGYMIVQFPLFKDTWLNRNQTQLQNVVELFISTIKRIESTNIVNATIKNLTNTNALISTLFEKKTDGLSHAIVLQLKHIFGFEHIILPEDLGSNIQWASSSVDVPIDIQNAINQLQIMTKLRSPYCPIQYSNKKTNTPQMNIICNYYQCEEFFVIPIVQNDTMTGYFLALNKVQNIGIDIRYLHLISQHISSILYRAIINKNITSTRGFYQEIIDKLSSCIVVFDHNLKILYSNQPFKTFFQGEYQTLKDLITHYPSLEIIEKIWDFSESEITIDIANRQFKLSLSELIDRHMVVTLTDVTNLIKIQQKISKSSKLKSLGTFVAGIIHEIKNPLVAVKTFTQLVSKDWENKELRDKCQGIVLPQLQRITKLSSSLHHLDRFEMATFEPSNVSKLLTHTLELIKAHQTYNSDIKIIANIEPKAMVFSDTQALGQVILNLALNAVDVVKNNKDPEIKLSVVTEDYTNVVIEVEDNGGGIAEADVPYLFDPFFTTKADGTGLGLSIVHQIITDHRGSIELYKNTGSCTTFRIVLPKLLKSKIREKETA